MKSKHLILTTLGLTLVTPVLAQSNLILNPIFNQGNSGGVPNNWSQNGGGNYNYADAASPDYGNGGQIWSFGWWNGAAIWQNTTATVQANTTYQMSVVADVGQAPLTGLNLSFQDVSKGWTVVSSQNFNFSANDQSDGAYETFVFNIPSSSLTADVGDTIGAGVTLIESPSNQYGWVHFDSVSLVAVPEPASMPLFAGLAMAGVGLVSAGVRRRKV